MQYFWTFLVQPRSVRFSGFSLLAPAISTKIDIHRLSYLQIICFGQTLRSDQHRILLTEAMQPTCRAIASPLIDASNSFVLGSRHYLTRPSGYKRHYDINNSPENGEEGSLATCFQVDGTSTIDAERLRSWPAMLLDTDDVFHPAFLQEIVFVASKICIWRLTQVTSSKVGRQGKSASRLNRILEMALVT